MLAHGPKGGVKVKAKIKNKIKPVKRIHIITPDGRSIDVDVNCADQIDGAWIPDIEIPDIEIPDIDVDLGDLEVNLEDLQVDLENMHIDLDNLMKGKDDDEDSDSDEDDDYDYKHDGEEEEEEEEGDDEGEEHHGCSKDDEAEEDDDEDHGWFDERGKAHDKMRKERERERERARQERDRARQERERAREERERAREEARVAREEARRAQEEARREAEEARHEAERAAQEAAHEAERHIAEMMEPRDVSLTATLTGPAAFEIEMIQGDIEIIATGNAKQLTFIGEGCTGGVSFDQEDNEVEIEFDGIPQCSSVQVQVPSGSSVDVGSVNGDVQLRGSFGDVDIEAVSGNIEVESARNVDVEAVSGNVVLTKVTGEAHVESMSGDTSVTQTGTGPRLDFSSASGSLDWSGTCGKGCRLKVEAFSGDARLQLGGSSSFELRYKTRDGELSDGLGVELTKPDKNGRSTRARFGKGEGTIDIRSFQGDVSLSNR